MFISGGILKRVFVPAEAELDSSIEVFSTLPERRSFLMEEMELSISQSVDFKKRKKGNFFFFFLSENDITGPTRA